MDSKGISEIKASLIKLLDPYHVYLPSDKERLINILAFLTNTHITRLPNEVQISCEKLSSLEKIIQDILLKINTQVCMPFKADEFKSLMRTEWVHPNPELTEPIKKYILEWLEESFLIFIKKFEGELVKFYIDMVLRPNDLSSFESFLAYLDQRITDLVDKYLILDLYKIYDIYHKQFKLINKRSLIIEMHLPVNSPEEILNSIPDLIGVYLHKIYHSVSFDKAAYQDLYLNLSTILKDKINIHNYLNYSKSIKNNGLNDSANVQDKEREMLLLATKATECEITINEFQKLLLLIAHPKTIIDLRQYNDSHKNLLELTAEIKHFAVKDLIDAIISKIIIQRSSDEAVNLFNKYFCFNWAVKAKDLNNFKKILSICQDIDLTQAEGKAFFVHLEGFSSNERYEFLKIIITDTINNTINTSLALELLLHMACENNFNDLAEILLTQGLRVNLSFKSGITPLHIAASNGNIDLVKKLLEHKASADIKTTAGHTPLYLATANGHSFVRDFLLNLQ